MTSPHAQEPVLRGGRPVRDAGGALIFLHGRGSSAANILLLGEALAPADWALLAPQAAENTWYPYSFLAAREDNEPWLSSALEKVESVIQEALTEGMELSQICLAGFSQGACLATEFVGRHPRRYGSLVSFTGGLIGPLEQPLQLEGDLAGTPILLSGGDPDPHVPWSRVEESGRLLRGIGGEVVLNRYPGKPHSVAPIEMELAQKHLSRSFRTGS